VKFRNIPIIGEIQEYSDFGLSVNSGIFGYLIIGEIQEYSDFGLSVKFRNLVLL